MECFISGTLSADEIQWHSWSTMSDEEIDIEIYLYNENKTPEVKYNKG